MDDVVVKTKNPDILIEDLKQTFENLKKWKWKLNPNKCVFGVPSGQLVNYSDSWSVIMKSRPMPSKFEL
jgi:hypothetical protein